MKRTFERRTPLRWVAAAVVAVQWIVIPAEARGDEVAAELSYPTAGAKITDLTLPFRWKPVAAAQSYLLVIGSAPGQADIWMSGDVNGTSVLVTRNLTKGPRHYARLWTKAHGILRHSSDVPFTVQNPTGLPKAINGPPFAPVSRLAMPVIVSAASMVFPAPGDPDVNFERPFSWTEVAGARAYQLLIGTAPGLGDVFDSGEMPRTWASVPALAAGSFHGRVATSVAGQRVFQDFVFGSTGSPAATLLSPANGSVLRALQAVLSWEAVPNAAAYRVVVGTTQGASNVADSGVISGTSFEVSSLPANVPLYVRLFTDKWNAWRFADTVFTASPNSPTLVTPLDGAISVNTGSPFEWRPSDPPSSYRLEIGTSPGGNDLHDTGEIWVPKRFVGPLPIGRTLYGRVSARVGGSWAPVDFRFTVAANSSTDPYVVSAALWATDYVRGMADEANTPYQGTPLAQLVASKGYWGAFCGDYSTVLLSILEQMNVTRPSRFLNICLKPNSYDGHTLVEFLEPGGTWMLLDPSFDLTIRRAADGQWATAWDVSQATKTMRFSDVTYQFLGERGDSVVRSNYLDYPLLYLNICDEFGCPGSSSLPYMDPVSMPVSSGGIYAIQGATGATVEALVNGTAAQFGCDPVDGLTYSFPAQSIDSLPGFSIQVFRPHRFVF